jgi:hypothetical protein
MPGAVGKTVAYEAVIDGDGTTLTISGGVPQAPSSTLLRAETDYSYDEQGRLYQQKVGKVDPHQRRQPDGVPPPTPETRRWRGRSMADV